jgi:hypothetical protein
MAEQISPALRGEVASRAGFCCEYCLMPEVELFAGCEVDHIISRKHQGESNPANLALSCERCNRAKGTDVGSVVGSERKFVRLFNPRTDVWRDHFRLEQGLIQSRTEIGEATVRLLRLNAPDRVLQRKALQEIGAYPIS